MHELPAGSFFHNYPKETRKDIVVCQRLRASNTVVLDTYQKKSNAFNQFNFLSCALQYLTEVLNFENIENTSFLQIAILYFQSMLSIQKLHLKTNTCSLHAIHDCHEAMISHCKY